MTKKILSPYVVFFSLILIFSVQALISDDAIPHDTERFVFESGHFEVAGELRPIEKR